MCTLISEITVVRAQRNRVIVNVQWSMSDEYAFSFQVFDPGAVHDRLDMVQKAGMTYL